MSHVPFSERYSVDVSHTQPDLRNRIGEPLCSPQAPCGSVWVKVMSESYLHPVAAVLLGFPVPRPAAPLLQEGTAGGWR